MTVDLNNESGLEADTAGLVRLAMFALDRLRIHPQAELSIVLVDEDTMAAYHRRYLDEAGPTDVLSFPMAEIDELEDDTADGPELMLGDIVLARGVCASEAAEKDISIEHHASHLPVHGTLHLLGYDHHDDDAASDMEAREVRALARLGISDPYQGSR